METGDSSSASDCVRAVNCLTAFRKADLSIAQSAGQTASSIPNEFDRARSRVLPLGSWGAGVKERLWRLGGLNECVVMY